MTDLDQMQAEHVAQIDQAIDGAAMYAAQLYLAAGVAVDQLPERVCPLLLQLAEMRADALVKLDANMIRMRELQVRMVQLDAQVERLNATLH